VGLLAGHPGLAGLRVEVLWLVHLGLGCVEVLFGWPGWWPNGWSSTSADADVSPNQLTPFPTVNLPCSRALLNGGVTRFVSVRCRPRRTQIEELSVSPATRPPWRTAGSGEPKEAAGDDYLP
jgi:hypothetical protein